MIKNGGSFFVTCSTFRHSLPHYTFPHNGSPKSNSSLRQGYLDRHSLTGLPCSREYDQTISPPTPTTSSTSTPFTPGPYTIYTHRRATGPHSAWNTRRPPSRTNPGNLNKSGNLGAGGGGGGNGDCPYAYTPFGRHTPRGWSGSSSGTYGDPFVHVREDLERMRKEGMGAREGGDDGGGGTGGHPFHPGGHHAGGGGGGGFGGGSMGNGETGGRSGSAGGGFGQVVGTISMVMVMFLIARGMMM